MSDELVHTPSEPNFSKELKDQMGVEVIPSSPESLEAMVKEGDKENSKTWWAEMLLRLMKKLKK